MRIAALAVAASLFCSCEFTQRHPAVTAGIVGGSIGFGACAVDNGPLATCGIVGGSAAVFLGGLMALVTIFADTTDHSLPPDEPEEPEIIRPRRHAVAPVAPEIVADAGVPDAPSPDAAPADAVLSPTHD
ncbi:MAG: hypothetical protein JWO36_1202 [Myxococcales bacterium]|nr:hypothetical protein [Myxococcales bacterium]